MNREHFIKVFLVSLLVFSAVIFTGLFTYNHFFNSKDILKDEGEQADGTVKDEEILDSDTPIEKAIKRSKRVNILLLGLEGTRSDTIILASYDTESKKSKFNFHTEGHILPKSRISWIFWIYEN